jgi:hypothetical protein
VETGSIRAASTTTQSHVRRDFLAAAEWPRSPRHRNALAYSPCLAFGFFFRHVEASFDPTITEREQHAVPPFDRSGSTFALTILCNKYVITPLAVVQSLLWS